MKTKTIFILLMTVSLSSVAQAQLIAPVDMIVTKNDDGSGNEQWEEAAYVAAVLDQASKLVSHVVDFKLTRSNELLSSDLYSRPQQGLHLKYATKLSGRGKIQVIISGPKTTTSSGLAWVGKSLRPVFAMRSNYNGRNNYMWKGAIDNTARIFLHELGHNMGLGHCKAGSSLICTDKYYTSQQGIDRLKNYLQNEVGGF